MANNVVIKIGATDEATKVLQKVGKQVARLGDQVTAAGAMMAKVGAGVAAGATAILAPLGKISTSFAEVGDQLNKLADRSGFTVERLSTLKFAAEQSGSSIESLGAALIRSTRRIANASMGTGPAVRALKELGLSAEELTKLTPEQQFDAVVASLAEMENQALANQFAFEVFGDNFKDILPLLQQGTEGIAALEEQAAQLGITLSKEDADAASRFQDSMNSLSSSLAGIKNQIGAAVVPALADLADSVIDIVRPVSQWISNNRDLFLTVTKIAAGVGVAGAALAGFGTVVAGVGLAITGLSGAIAALGSVVAAVFTPTGFVAAGTVAAITAVGVAVGKIATETGLVEEAASSAKFVLAEFGETARETFAGVSTAIQANDWGLAMQIAMAGMKVAVFEGIEDIGIAFASLGPKMLETLDQIFLAMFDRAKSHVSMIGQIIASPAAFATKSAAEILAESISGTEDVPDPEESSLVQWVKETGNQARKELEALNREAAERAQEFQNRIVTEAVASDAKAEGEKIGEAMGDGLASTLAAKAAEGIAGLAGMVGDATEGAAGQIAALLGQIKQEQQAIETPGLTATQGRLLTGGPQNSVQQKMLDINKKQADLLEKSVEAATKLTALFDKFVKKEEVEPVKLVKVGT